MAREYINGETGEILEDKTISNIYYADKRRHYKSLLARFEEDPNALTLEELYLLRAKKEKKITMGIHEIGWVSSLRQSELIRTLNDHTIALITKISYQTSYSGILLYRNGKYIRGFSEMRKEFNVPNAIWYKTVRPEFIANNILAYVKINKQRHIIVNPIFVHPHRKIDEFTFIAFEDSIKKYLDKVDFVILSKMVRGNNVMIERL